MMLKLEVQLRNVGLSVAKGPLPLTWILKYLKSIACFLKHIYTPVHNIVQTGTCVSFSSGYGWNSI